MLELDLIRIDGDTQSRVELQNEVVEEYSQAMAEGTEFPPVVVFFDGASYWLADGFHRYFGAAQAGIESIAADVRKGTQADAQLFSFGVNAGHGLRRTNADKRKAVAGALNHAVSCKWSDTQIAKHCGVSPTTVGDVRRSLSNLDSENSAERTYTTKHGTQAVMQTGKIGKAKFKGKPKKVPATKWVDAEISAANARNDAQAANARADALEAENRTLREAISPGTALDMADHRSIDVAPSQAQEPPPEYTALEAAQDTISDLQAALAIASMGDAPEADRQRAQELIAELQAEVKSLAAQLRAANVTRDALLHENAEVKKQLAAQRREIDRLKKQAGQGA